MSAPSRSGNREPPYVVVDVFTATRYGGNQLAVITDASALDEATMQRIANEFNFAETTFVLPPADPANTARVRIFTRAQEVAFAGHPNVGTAYVLGREGAVFGRETGPAMRFEEAAGLVEVALRHDGGATIAAPRDCEIGMEIDPVLIAACVGIETRDLRIGRHAPVQVSVGLQFVVAEVDPGAIGRARANLDAFAQAAALPGLADATGRFSTYIYARQGEDHARLRARMFAPLSGNFEDPATGSAAAALGAFLAGIEPGPGGDIAIAIEQGVEMGRPSLIRLDIPILAGRPGKVRITGDCVETMRGYLTLG